MKWIKNRKFKKCIGTGIASAMGICTICLCFFAINNTQTPTLSAENVSSQNPIINKSSENILNTSLDMAHETENAISVNKPNYVINENFEQTSNSTSIDMDENSDTSEIRTADLFETSGTSLFSFMQNNNSDNTQNGATLYYRVAQNSDKNWTLYIRNDRKTDYTEFDSGSAAPWVDKNQYKIKAVEIENEIQPTATIGWFGCATSDVSGRQKLSNIKTIKGLNNLDMTNVADATCMFAGSDLLDTPEVESTWFSKISSGDTKLTGALGMCNYTSLDNTFLTNMARAIAPSVTNASYAFANNNKNNLVSLDLYNVNFSNATSTSRMFYNNHDLKSIAALSLIANSGVQTVNDMFTNCENLNFIGLAADTNWQGKISQSADKPFIGCKSLKNWLDGNTGLAYANNTTTTGYFSEITTMSEAYAVVSNNAMTFYYDNEKSSHTEGTTYNVDLNLKYSSKTQNEQPYHVIASSVTSVTIDDTFANAPLLSTYNMFHDFSKITVINGLGNINVYNVVYAIHMFDGCSSIKSFDFSTWNTTHSVYYVSNMFTGCSSVEEITIGTKWDINFEGTDLRSPSILWYNKKTGDSYSSGSIPIYPYITEVTTYVTQLEEFDIILHSNNENWGTITTSDDDKKAHVGETVHLKVQPKDGFGFQDFITVPEGLTINKDSTTTDGYTFIMPEQAVDITANFKDGSEYWYITFSRNGVYGASGGAVPQIVQVEKGTTYTFTSAQAQGSLQPPDDAASAGYTQFAGWCTVQDPTSVKPEQSTYYQYQNDGYDTTITPTSHITLYAQWRKRVSLTADGFHYYPVINNSLTAGDRFENQGYHFYHGSDSNEIHSLTERLYRPKDLCNDTTPRTIFSDLCVEVDPGKGAVDQATGLGTGKCLGVRSAVGNFTTAIGQSQIVGNEYWCGSDWNYSYVTTPGNHAYLDWTGNLDGKTTCLISNVKADDFKPTYSYTYESTVFGTKAFLWTSAEFNSLNAYYYAINGAEFNYTGKSSENAITFSRPF